MEPAKPETSSAKSVQLTSKKKRKTVTSEFASVIANENNCNWKRFQQTMLKSKSKHISLKHSATKQGAIKRKEKKRHLSVACNEKIIDELPVKKLKEANNLVTNAVAIDCEMVGVDAGSDSILARISIVNKYGNCIYDKYVKPTEPVVDYRTHVSGIRPRDLENAETFDTVQKEVADIIRGRILVGHALKNDLKVLYLSHPRRFIRDTSRYKGFRKIIKGGTPSLKRLAQELLGVKIQEGEHDSIIDARTAMQLYVLYKKEWESDIRSKNKTKL